MPANDRVRADNLTDAEHRKLAAAVQLFPEAVVCLLSALPFHGLADRYPNKVWLAVRRRIVPTDIPPNVEVELISMPAWSASDIVELDLGGQPISVFGAAKTIGDCLRHRALVGYPIAINAFNDAVRLGLTTSEEVARMDGLCYGWDRHEHTRT